MGHPYIKIYKAGSPYTKAKNHKRMVILLFNFKFRRTIYIIAIT